MISPKRKEKLIKERNKAIKLYQEGYSLRDVALKMKRSHTWVWMAVKNIWQHKQL